MAQESQALNEWQVHEYINEQVEGMCNLCCGEIKPGKQFPGEPDVLGIPEPRLDGGISPGVYERNQDGLWTKVADTWDQYWTNKDFEQWFTKLSI